MAKKSVLGGRRNKKVLLPLLHVLKSIQPQQRQILLAHFDDATRDLLYATIAEVLRSSRVPFQKRLFLRAKLSPYKNDLRYLNSPKKTKEQKRKKLQQLGAGPVNHIFRTAIPLLLNLFPK